MLTLVLVILMFVGAQSSIAQPASLCLRMVELGMYARAVTEGERLLKSGYRDYYTYSCLAEAHEGMDNYSLSIKYTLRMQERATSKPQRLLTFIRLGRLYSLIADYGKSLESYNRALSISMDIKSTSMEVFVLNQIAETYRKMNDYEKAIISYNQIYNMLEDNREKLKVMEKLADTLVLTKKYEDAIKVLDLAIVLSIEINDMKALTRTYINMGSVYRSMGERTKAYQSFNEGVQNAQVIGDRLMQAVAHEQLGEMELEELDLEKAEKSFQTARQLYSLEGKRAEVKRIGEKLEIIESFKRLKHAL
ncbi:MAG: hypothetical protein NZ526_07370 [Aquificaceae bacterium]|nr:hypothetical protein [Aquificaceae bacterium]